MRWQHPERGLLGPGAFVPLAEQTGVMGELTEHVLDAALRQVAAWYARGLDLTVAVNVSAATLLDEGWATDVASALVRHGVPASRLRIEITEDALMADPERALRGRREPRRDRASACPSTTSAPATRRSACSSTCRSTS